MHSTDLTPYGMIILKCQKETGNEKWRQKSETEEDKHREQVWGNFLILNALQFPGPRERAFISALLCFLQFDLAFIL